MMPYYMWVLAVYFVSNITILLHIYCEDEKLDWHSDKDVILITFLFGLPFIIGIAIHTFIKNRGRRKDEKTKSN